MARVAGNLNEARKRFEDALGLDAKNVGALTGLGVMLHEAGKPTDAIAKCRVAKTLEPLYTGAALCLVRASLTPASFSTPASRPRRSAQPERGRGVFPARAGRRVAGSAGPGDRALPAGDRGQGRLLRSYSLAQLYIEEKKPEEAMGALQAQGAVGDTAALRTFGEVHRERRADKARRVRGGDRQGRRIPRRASTSPAWMWRKARSSWRSRSTRRKEQARDFPGLAEARQPYLKIAEGESGRGDRPRARGRGRNPRASRG